MTHLRVVSECRVVDSPTICQLYCNITEINQDEEDDTDDVTESESEEDPTLEDSDSEHAHIANVAG